MTTVTLHPRPQVKTRRESLTADLVVLATEDFARFYRPLCREIELDNWVGRFLFRFTHVFQHHAWLTLPHLRSITAEQALPPKERFHSRLLWGMFTGTYPYRDLLAMACHPRLHVSLFRHLLSDLAGHHRDRPVQTHPAD